MLTVSPLIAQDHAVAVQDHAVAVQDHAVAVQDHAVAVPAFRLFSSIIFLISIFLSTFPTAQKFNDLYLVGLKRIVHWSYRIVQVQTNEYSNTFEY